MEVFESFDPRLVIIGLGYVGLPLAVEFGKKYPTIGFDINAKRIAQLNDGIDITKEADEAELLSTKNLSFTTDASLLVNSNVFIVTVPTPVDSYNNPDLEPICKATETLAKFLKKDSIVIYESTVYPGVTEDVCVPIIEKISGLKYNEDFFCGYSPERINPGDKKNRLTTIRKITSGSTPEIAELIDRLYSSIITGGTFKASCIKVAEAAKVIENAQRDINIAFMNEIAKIFNHLSIDTLEVLEAAGTKWNFLNFRPGLVGGHCIGVDPYYLAQKAQSVGYYPEIILAGRRVNDGMGEYIATEVVRLLIESDKQIKNAKVLILGITFKENCPDIRNTRVIDIHKSLLRFKIGVDIADPYANAKDVKEEYGLDLADWSSVDPGKYDCIILAVGHDKFHEIDIANLKTKGCIVYDVKSFYPKKHVSARL
jgi:UDP-N-acetyl-D-galactosamine dehydrogenase